MGKKDKRPKAEFSPVATKSVKFSTDPSFKGGPISWRFSHADKGGPFAWTCFDDPAVLSEVMERLVNIEGLEEHKLREAGSHPVETHKLSKEARDRLVELQHDDLDTLFSLRVTGERRVFCIHHGNIMRVLWYDPKHEVFPSKLKHT